MNFMNLFLIGNLLSLLSLISLWGCQSHPNKNVFDEPNKVVDLTYAFNKETVYWPTEDGFHLEKEFFGKTEKGYFYSANKFQAAEHGGTHLDAPIHFYGKKHSVDQIPLENLMGNGIVVDVQDKVSQNRDYQITIEDFLQWEKHNGVIPPGSIILLRTGFGKYYPHRQSYLGTNEKGPQAVVKLHFPGIHPEAAQWIAEERKIKAIGLDTPSIDYGQSRLFQSHVIFCQRNIPIFENVANLHQLPAHGFYVVALPMKIEGGSGGPLRIIAII